MEKIKIEPGRPISRRSPLRILHLEDDPADAALVNETLAIGGIPHVTTVVDTGPAFEAALKRGEMDMIISDFALPTFDGLSALQMTRAEYADLPFIVVSGTLGEELAIESLKRGATDYVLKNRLTRLVPAVNRAMKEIHERDARRMLEARFIEAQKMEVVGQLAGGVAHDFNNIIAIIMGYSDLMAQKLGPDSTLKSHLEAIRMAAVRAAGLTRQLLVFSRKQTVQPVVLDINDVVGSVEQMLRRLIDEHIEVAFVRGAAGRIKADSGYVGQVLMNLVVNARDAMPRGGKLTVATGAVTIDATEARRHAGVAPGDFVVLSVTDTGTGMTEEVRAHLFEAFFTTKPKGKGTGLGLVTCQNIIQQCGGFMDVTSAVGQGATFKVCFPRVNLPLEHAANNTNKGPLPRGSEAVLVVEDDPAVRHLARSVLETQGYEVITAANGEDGLRAAREHKRSLIRLVVTDVIMPHMGGKAMAEWLKTTHPDVKVLFTSGYTDDTIAHHGVLDPGVAFLPKPYTASTFTRKVREILDSSQ